MVEQDIVITESGGYSNIDLKPKPLKGIKGLDNGNYVIVEKVYAEGRAVDTKYGISYACKVKYKGTEVSFWLKDFEHEKYKTCGGIGDKVKITLSKEPFVNKKTGVEMLLNKLKFEKV